MHSEFEFLLWVGIGEVDFFDEFFEFDLKLFADEVWIEERVPYSLS